MKKFFYRVTNLDSVQSLSKRFSIPVGKIISLNALKRDVEEGDLLYLEQVDAQTYVVKPTDTLTSIAEKFCLPASEILKENATDYLYYSQVILIKKGR